MQRDGIGGLVYRKDRNHGTIMPAKGQMCFRLRLRKAGNYFMTFISYAPHPTDNNDAWIKVNKQLKLVSLKKGGGSISMNPNVYLKAYQNNGKKYGMSSDMHTKDNDPHKFIIMRVRAGENIKICIAGRSFRFEVYRIILKRCSRRLRQNGGHISIRSALRMKVSRCINTK